MSKVHFLAFICLKHMYSASGNYMLDILFYKKDTEKQKCCIFTFDKYRILHIFFPTDLKFNFLASYRYFIFFSTIFSSLQGK